MKYSRLHHGTYQFFELLKALTFNTHIYKEKRNITGYSGLVTGIWKLKIRTDFGSAARTKLNFSR